MRLNVPALLGPAPFVRIMSTFAKSNTTYNWWLNDILDALKARKLSKQQSFYFDFGKHEFMDI